MLKNVCHDDQLARDLIDEAVRNPIGTNHHVSNRNNRQRPVGTTHDRALRHLRDRRPDLHARGDCGEIVAACGDDRGGLPGTYFYGARRYRRRSKDAESGVSRDKASSTSCTDGRWRTLAPRSELLRSRPTRAAARRGLLSTDRLLLADAILLLKAQKEPAANTFRGLAADRCASPSATASAGEVNRLVRN
jgi:hypothetical protein